MEKSKIDMFRAMYADKLPTEKLPDIFSRLENAPDDKFATISCVEMRNPITILILSIFFGYLGVDRFLIGDIGLGLGKLITGGGCGIWAVVDWFLIIDATRQSNFLKLLPLLE